MPVTPPSMNGSCHSGMTRREFLPLAGAGLAATPLLLNSCSNDTLKIDDSGGINLPGTVVWASDRTSTWSIFMSRFDSEQPVNLTQESFHDDSQPVWIDNGQKIVFVSSRSGSPNLHLINDVQNPGSSIEQVTDLTGDVAFPELSPDGSSVFFCFKSLVEPLFRICHLDLSDNTVTEVCSMPAGKSQLRFIDSNKILLGPIILGEIDITTGTFNKYIYNHIDVTSFDMDCSVATFDISEKTGAIYAALDNSPFDYYRVYSWDYENADNYKALAGGVVEWNDVWRSFRILDMGGTNDVVLGSQRTAVTTLGNPTNIGPFKIGVWNQKNQPLAFKLSTMRNMFTDNLYPDWTSVEHIQT